MKYDGFKRTAYVALIVVGGFVFLMIAAGFLYGGFELLSAIMTYYIYKGAGPALTGIMSAFGGFAYAGTIGVVVFYFLGLVLETLLFYFEEFKKHV